MKIRSLLHPIRSYKNRRRYNFYKSSAFNRLVDTNPKEALDIFWMIQKQYPLNWSNPQTVDEKIFWLEGMTDTTLWTTCSDKYLVRKYIEDIGLEHTLTKLYGVWTNAKDINFDLLPKKFVLKCNHDCHSAIVIKDKSSIDEEEIKTKLSHCLKIIYGYKTCEPHYTRIKPLIIAEELIEDNHSAIESSSLIDYKFFCFSGKPQLCLVCYDRESGHALKDLYQIEGWSRYPKTSKEYSSQNFKETIPCPANLPEMLSIAERIANGFPFLRVDLYNVGGKIYFGEMTFTPRGGFQASLNEEAQYELGKEIDLTHIPQKLQKR